MRMRQRLEAAAMIRNDMNDANMKLKRSRQDSNLRPAD